MVAIHYDGEFIKGNDCLMPSPNVPGMVVGMERKFIDELGRLETDEEYRQRCFLDPRCVGEALTVPNEQGVIVFKLICRGDGGLNKN